MWAVRFAGQPFSLDGCNTFLVPETDNLGIERVLRAV
jgi:hypothetical protein